MNLNRGTLASSLSGLEQLNTDIKNKVMQSLLVSPDVVDCEWDRLTKVPEKRMLFGVDPYFRAGYLDFRHRNGGSFPYETLHQTAVLFIQPDGVSARIGKKTLSFLESNGFELIATSLFKHTYHSVREEWRYQFNEMTLPRMDITSAKYMMGPSLLLVLRSNVESNIPASVRLQRLKGRANPSGRRKNQLRSLVNSPNGLLKFVHSPDEPADIVRELSTALTAIERREVVRIIVEPPREQHSIFAEFESCLRAAYSVSSAHDFCIEAAAERRGLITYVDPEALNDVTLRFDGAVWFELSAGLEEMATDAAWDLIISMSDSVPAKYPETKSLIDTDGSEHWEA